MQFITKFLTSPFGGAISSAALRSAILGVLFLSAYLFLEGLIGMSRHYDHDLASTFPELMVIFRAVAILAWFELSIMWFNIAVSFKTNKDFKREEYEGRRSKPEKSAGTEAVKMFQWTVRLIVLMQLSGFWS